jgi:DNA-binding beta-propeller fold protein YncE
VDTTTGELTIQSSATIAPTVFINEVALHPSGSHLYTRNTDGTNMIFGIDAVSGDLSGPTDAPAGRGAGMLFSRTGNFVYYPTTVFTAPSSFGPSSVRAYSVSGTTLTELQGSPHPTAQGRALNDVIDPTGNYLVTSDIDDNQIFAFKIDSATGALTAVPGSPFTPDVGTNLPSTVAFDPSGRFAYLADVGGAQNPSTNTISAYSIDAATGVPTFIASYPTGDNPSFFPRIIGRQ